MRAPATEGSLTETGIWTPALIFIAVAGVYALLPSKNYYWDGISSAQTIEDATRTTWPALFHPNHLVYNVIGFIFYAGAKHFGIRALSVLQYLNIVLSAAAAVVLHVIVRRLTGSNFFAVHAFLLFAFSATWWRFSTVADSYIPCVFLLLVMAWLILCAERVHPVRIAIVHMFAMIIHQLAVLMFPAVIVGLVLRTHGRARLRTVALYSTIASSLTLAAYYAGFAAQTRKLAVADFLRWLTSHSPDAQFTFTMPKNIIAALKSQVNVFLDGRLSFLFQARSGVVAILAILWAVSLIVLIRAAIVQRRMFIDLFRASSKCLSHPEIIFAGTWILSYVAFLLFWLPHNTFYRLFYLPALIVIPAILWSGRFHSGNGGQYVLTALVLCIGLFNLTFYIYPYSQIWANPPLALALEANKVWHPGTQVIFDQFTTDNWMFRYFNPQTDWIALNELDSEKLKAVFSRAQQGGEAVWLDVTASERMHQSPACENQERLELMNDKYHILFLQAFPCSIRSP